MATTHCSLVASFLHLARRQLVEDPAACCSWWDCSALHLQGHVDPLELE